MTVQAALKAALRDVVGPAARAHGFKGSAPNWRRSNDLGDWAIVNVQSSKYSTRESLRCVINLSVAPEPWLAWTATQRGSLPRSPSEAAGLYRKRLLPTGTPEDVDGWWEVNAPDEAPAVATDMVRRLDGAGWPTLERLLDRDAMLDQVRAGDLGFIKREFHPVLFAHAQAMLLSDEGPSAELNEQLAYALDHAHGAQREGVREFVAWVRERSQTGPAER